MSICMYSTFVDKALLGKKVFLVSYNAVEFLSNKHQLLIKDMIITR